MTLWSKRLVAAALVAATVTGLPAGASATPSEPQAPPEPEAPQASWQLRAQVRPGPRVGLTQPRRLADAVPLMRQAACREARDLLWDGQPGRSKVQLTLWRQSGPEDGISSGVSEVDCASRFGRVSAFRLKARVGWPEDPGDYTRSSPMALGSAVAKASELANTLAGRVLQSEEQAWITVRMWTVEKTPRQMVRALARRYGVNVSTALGVAACESGFRPKAYSHPYAGIYQQHLSYWPRRARHYGHRGASPFDAYANIDVSLRMARAVGWGHWGCA